MFLDSQNCDAINRAGVQRHPWSDSRLSSVRPRLARAKAAYTTRRVDLDSATRILDDVQPRVGDLVLARVAALGNHTRIELVSGRRAYLHPGDEIVVCFGARYAPDQFEAYVPSDLGPCSLVAAGGVAARCESRHTRMRAPTALEPIGILARDDATPLNLNDFAMPPKPIRPTNVPIVAVLGTSMNSGKTTAATALVRGAVTQGQHVAAAKVTGTGAGHDRWSVQDAGAETVLDFTDAGVPSTFGYCAERIEQIFATLVTALIDTSPDLIVIEIADGLLHEETAALVDSPLFRSCVDGVFFCAGDALGAKAGMLHLSQLGVRVLALSGLLTCSPLAVREAERATGACVLTANDLEAGAGSALLASPVAAAVA